MKKIMELNEAVQIKKKIKAVNSDYETKAGDAGEDTVKSKLIYSKYPMYFLHDVRLVHEGKTAQIDFIAVTRRMIFVIECKHFGFNVKVDSEGQFINITENRSFKSPLEQNREHIDVLTRIFPELSDRFFPVIVFSNTSRILDRSETDGRLKSHIVKIDELIPAMQKINEENKKTGFLFKKGLDELSDSEMKKYADDFSAHHTEKKPAPKVSDGYVCPNCRKEVKKGQYGFYCTAKCGMNFNKIYGHELSENQIVYLLKNAGKSIKINIGGTESIVYAEALKKGNFIQWKTVSKPKPVQEEKKSVPAQVTKAADGYICPNCRKEVKKGQYGFYCTARCGMNFNKIYGQDIPESQVKSLLSGNKITINTKCGQKILVPSAETRESNGRTFIQWAVK